MTCLAIILCCASPDAAAQPPPQIPPVFRSGVGLVTIDVTVVDKNGAPVRDLTADDFVVTLDGESRPIRALDYLQFGATSGASAAPLRETTNQDPTRSAGRGGRSILLLFDDLSYSPGTGRGLTTAAQRTLASLDLDDFVGVASTSGQGPYVHPSRDRAAVSVALSRMIGRNDHGTAPFYIGVHEAVQIESGLSGMLRAVAARECPILGLPEDVCAPMVASAAHPLARNTFYRTTKQLAAVQAAMETLRPLPEPKILVLLSNGIATSPELGNQRELDPLDRVAAEAGVQLYALVEVPDPTDASDLTMARAGARRDEGAFLNDSVQTMASAAGGQSFRVAGTADRFFGRIVSKTSGIYRLGVDAPGTGRFLRARVTSRRSGLTIRASSQAIADSAAFVPPRSIIGCSTGSSRVARPTVCR